MHRLEPLPDNFSTTRDALKRVAVHVVARARSQATGRFGMRVTVAGFGTPDFGDDLARIRVSGGLLVRESGGTSGARAASVNIDASTLSELAAFAQVDLAEDLDVGHDTPPLGDVDQRLAVDGLSARALGDWFAMIAEALDRVVSSAQPEAEPSLTQLWPEHFDVALDLAATPDRRANLGGSPGDGFSAEPYVYVGPWTADRPGDQQFWNAPFGAALKYSELAGSEDPVADVATFFRLGLAHLAS